MEEEIWKDIPDYEGFYRASTFGRIKSLLRTVGKSNGSKQTMSEKIMSPGFSGDYYAISLTKNNEPKRFYVHKLIALCFIEIDLTRPQVNHLDGNKLNNRKDNLERCTISENSKHAIRTGLLVMPNIQGTNNGRCKLTTEKVIQIRSLHGVISQYEIAKKFGMKQAQISTIINRKGWTHI